MKFGPINPVNGFPDWYRDSNGVEVEPCLSNFDPKCNAPTPAPDPNSEVSFPDNFPDEFFYFTGEASLTANGGNDVLALYTIEGTYGGGNTQTVFGRTRYRIRGGLVAGRRSTRSRTRTASTRSSRATTRRSSSPTTSASARGNFGGLFEGQVGPFLKWDSSEQAAPGYLGDPAVQHTVTGSPFDTNFVKIEGPNVGGAGNPNPCPGLDARRRRSDCIYTDLFSILGKKSTRGGVEVARATYSLAPRPARSRRSTSWPSRRAARTSSSRTRSPAPAAASRSRRSTIEQSRYFTHVNVQGELPDGGRRRQPRGHPADVKRSRSTDHVIGTALYNADTDKLHVQAESSDKTMPLTDLTVAGFRPTAPTRTARAARTSRRRPRRRPSR